MFAGEDWIVIQVSVVATSHVQSLAVVTLIELVIATDVCVRLESESVKKHCTPAWITSMFWPATSTSPVRPTVDEFAAKV
jgi:hypothetical protein